MLMTTLRRNPRPSWTGMLAVAVGLIIVLGIAVGPPDPLREGLPPGGAGSASVTDLSDRRQLVGFAEHVFVGRVVARTGEWNDNPTGADDLGPSPFPLFAVDVSRSIKGELPQRVTVVQNHVGPDNPHLLRAGREYVFVTNPSENGPWQIVIPSYGSTPADGEGRTRVIAEFEQAYREQIPYENSAEGQ